MWLTDHLLDVLLAAVRAREEALCAEHAVYGLDALQEVDLHPLLAGGLEAAGYGVLREHHYPHEWQSKLERGASRRRGILPRDRMRCDLVVTPERGQALHDPLLAAETARAIRAEATGGLFESVAATDAPHIASQAAPGVPPEDAYWLEVKLIAQHCYSRGIPEPNHTYASELRRAAADIEKLTTDDRIHHAGLLYVLFTESPDIARHDLMQITHACLDDDLPIASPLIRSTAVRERIGNSCLTLGLIDVRKPTL